MNGAVLAADEETGNVERITAVVQAKLLKVRTLVLCSLDAMAWFVALGVAALIRFDLSGQSNQIPWLPFALSGIVAGALQFGVAALLLKSVGTNRIGTFGDAKNVVKAWAAVSLLIVPVYYLLSDRPAPIATLVSALPLALLAMLSVRFIWRSAVDQSRQTHQRPGSSRVLVFGAGGGGEQIINAMLNDVDPKYYPVGLLDDAPSKANREICGVRVLGDRFAMAQAARANDANLLLVAIPSADAKLLRELSELATAANLEVLVLPGTSQLLGLLTTHDIREITEIDLLGRTEVEVDEESILSYLTNKRGLVTGAGGSIGSELCQQIARYSPANLYMLDRDETALHGLQLSMTGRALLDTGDLVVADIRDQDRILEIFEKIRPEVVFHTAALKHLTLLEQNPGEGAKTNVGGTNNLLLAAMAVDVNRFVNVSTDKAADPTSVLGRTKLMAERLTGRAANQTGERFVSVRFGNVLGSRGSVLPTFRRQIARGGPVTVTHEDATRFFMTIPEAVRLVLQAGAIGKPGEIMILDMGKPVKIMDVAKRLIHNSGKHVKIEFTGLRPGEKLHEVLRAKDEVEVQRQHPRIFHTTTQIAGEDPASDAELCGGEDLLACCLQQMTIPQD